MITKGSREVAREARTVLHILFCSLSNNSKKQLGAPAQTWQWHSIHGCLVVLETQSNLRGNFSNWDNARAPIQFRKESQPQYLKGDFSSRTNPSIFTSIPPVLLDQLKPGQLKQLSFSSIEINKPLPAPVHIIHQIRFKIRSQF